MAEKEATPLEICNLCWKELHQVKEMAKCKHMFHAHCINSWLERNNCCPLCRLISDVATDIISIVPEYEDDDDLYFSIEDILMEDERDDIIIPILIPDHEDSDAPIGLGNVDNDGDALVDLVESYMEEFIPLLDPMSLGNDDELDMMLDQEEEDAYIESLVFETSDDDWYTQEDDTETQYS